MLATVMACNSPSTTEMLRTVPTEASTPFPERLPEPLLDHLIETLDPITGTPAIGQLAPSTVAATASPVPQDNLIWRLSSPDDGPFQAGEEMSLTLELDPQNLAVSGIQFRVNYPVELLQLIEVVPGAILGANPLLVDKLDRSQGKVLFAIARRGDTVGPTGSGRVAVIKMRTIQDLPETGSVMIWLDRVKLTDGDFQTIGQDSVAWLLSGPG